MFIRKLILICMPLGAVLFIFHICKLPTIDIDAFDKNSRISSNKLKASAEPKQENRCHNKGRFLNDWNYFLKKVIHAEQIYYNIDTTGYVPDLQTWTNIVPTFEKFLKIYLTKISKKRPDTEPIRIIEVGSWKGSSSLAMAQICRTLAHPRKCKVLAVDTWLGAPVVYTDQNAIIHMELEANNGKLQLFDKFLKNMILMNATDIVTPFRLPSLGAAHVLNCFGIKADMVYIDGDHEYDGVKADLAAYYPLVENGGLFFGDDAPNPNVRRAVQEMVTELGEKIKVADSGGDTATWLVWNEP